MYKDKMWGVKRREVVIVSKRPSMLGEMVEMRRDHK